MDRANTNGNTNGTNVVTPPLNSELQQYKTQFLTGRAGTSRGAHDAFTEQLCMTPLFSWPVKEAVAARAQFSATAPIVHATSINQPSGIFVPHAELDQRSGIEHLQTISANGQHRKRSLKGIRLEDNAGGRNFGASHTASGSLTEFTQYAFMGSIVASSAPDVSTDEDSDTVDLETFRPMCLNTNTPWSAFICGSQGSGKSHTLGCMLEGCLINSHQIGKLPYPLAGMVFNYNSVASGPSEAYGIHSGGVKTTVLCSPTNLFRMKQLYQPVPGAETYLKVEPLYLESKHLNIERMWRLMAFSDTEKDPPLYMQTVRKVLRSMAENINLGRKSFDYYEFVKLIAAEQFSDKQNGPLRLRLDVLESFMRPNKAAASKNILAGEPGTLTIVDLTDPFLDADTACLLFDICLSEFLEKTPCGKIVALDEAHNYMNKSSGSEIFTDKLLKSIREQRHNAARFVVATQEPTISPILLDLCTMTFVHRFTSPAWFAAIKEHIGGASTAAIGPEGQNKMLQEILGLKLGESLLFSPSAALKITDAGEVETMKLGRLKFMTRPRITHDAGMSVLATRRA